jgi:hypothetical protein
MSPPLSPRAMLATFSGLATGVVVVSSLFVWPGLLVTTGCVASAGPNESVKGRAYCVATVPIPRFYANYTAWGFTFHLFVPPTPGISGMRINVTEPNGAKYSGGNGIGGAPRSNFTSMWFTPDNESGVTVVWNTLDGSLLAEKGF